MRSAFAAALAAVALLVAAPLHAQMREAPPLAEDPVLEAHVMRLAGVLRCLVCQNQTLADSNAELAVDLRNQLREQIKAGRSDAQIIEYLVARYGDFVLYRPPVKATTVLLWAGPFALLLAGLAGLAVTLRRRARAQAAQAAELDRRANERIADWVKRFPERFTGTFTIPMHHMDVAIKEFDYAVNKLGLKIANVSSNAGGAYLGDPKFREFWEAVVQHDVTVLIHPHGVTDPRFQKFALWNGVGQPIEETMAMTSLTPATPGAMPQRFRSGPRAPR